MFGVPKSHDLMTYISVGLVGLIFSFYMANLVLLNLILLNGYLGS